MTPREHAQAVRDARNRRKNAGWSFPRLKRFAKREKLPAFTVEGNPSESEHCGVREWAPLKLVKGSK